MDVWEIMRIPGEALGRGTSVEVTIDGDPEAMAVAMAEEMAGLIRTNNEAGQSTCLIVPVGPVGQYAHLARIIASEPLDCSRVTFINMDEFVNDRGELIDTDHPLSFRGFMNRVFYDRLPASAGFRSHNRVFPDPRNPQRIREVIEDRGGVTACFGGIGLNGHIAFNEPRPAMGVDGFAALGTREVTLDPASRAHMAVNLSCSLDLIPGRAVTVGMSEILGAERLHLHANRPWQRGVVRQMLHGPVTSAFPASYIQRHPNAQLTIAGFLAETREVELQ
ncbi:MAG: glucosamine-6-phosphate isomerase [Longimicrobiales bacterium]|nr:glucosamine-6-phosphate isomerase [Longimicrobiales bacterium]